MSLLIKQGLIKMKEGLAHYPSSDLHYLNLLVNKEQQREDVRKYLDKNIPKLAKIRVSLTGFWYSHSDKTSARKWLNKQIKKIT